MRFACSVLGISILALGTALAPAHVEAGFEWVAPKEDMSKSRELNLPEPKPGTPRISPEPLGDGLDPLPPLSVDQENGTRDTVYAAPRRARPPVVEEAAPREQESLLRARTIKMNAPREELRTAGTVSAAMPDDAMQPKQLRMSEKLIAPPDEAVEAPSSQDPLPEAEGRVAINPAPIISTAPMPVSPARREALAAEAVPAGPVLEGFGSEIPLVMALQQVLPPEYTYSFSSSVNPGESVSWEGGKNWALVLGEMLEDAGLSATVKGRSVLIKQGLYDQRADAASVEVAEDMAATMPAAGSLDVEAPKEIAAETAPLPIEKVDAVPPVYPQEVLEKKEPSGASRLLGRISEKLGLRVEDLKVEEVTETTEVQGSPAEAKAARQNVVDHALGLAAADGEPGALPIDDAQLPVNKLTSYTVTKTSHKLTEPPARRANITDPGEEPGTQPEVQALNLKPAAKETVMAAVAEPQTPLAVPTVSMPSGTVSRNLGADEQRKQLQDMARQQGIVLDAKNYNDEALGKIFNNGIAPASGESGPSGAASATTGAVSLQPQVPESQPVASPSVAPPGPADSDFWEASKGNDLQEVLGQWSKNSGVTLVWKAGRDYQIGSNIMVHGKFNDAIKTLFAQGTKSGDFPVMSLNDDGAGKGTLVIEDKS